MDRIEKIEKIEKIDSDDDVFSKYLNKIAHWSLTIIKRMMGFD